MIFLLRLAIGAIMGGSGTPPSSGDNVIDGIDNVIDGIDNVVT